MSHSLLQRQSFPSSPVSGRDISSQRAGPVNLSVKKKTSAIERMEDIPIGDQPCAGLDSIAALEPW